MDAKESFHRLQHGESDGAVSARAVEVATMLGDSVVGVKHCTNPRGGTLTPATWGLFAIGAISLVSAGLAFVSSVRTAAANHEALAYHTNVLKKPAYAFRPTPVPFGVSVLALGGLTVGLAGLTAGLVRLRKERRSPYFRVGTAPEVEQPVEGAPAACFPLVAPAGDAFVFNAGPGIDGELLVAGERVPFAQLLAEGHARPSMEIAGAIEIPIRDHARIRARAGETTFLVSAVEPPREHPVPLFAAFEQRTLAYVAGSLAAHLAIWAGLQSLPPEGASVNVELAAAEDVGIRGTTTDHEQAPLEDVPAPSDGSGDSEGAGATMRLAAGAAGRPDAAQADGHLRIEDTGQPPALSRAEAIEQARNAGILGASPALSTIHALAATGDYASGFDAASVYGPLFGGDGEGRGTFGFGVSGFGPGGGCALPPCGTVGTGRYGTIGVGRGAGDGWNGPGGGNGPAGRRVSKTPPPRIGEPTSSGDGLDRAIIRRYIKRSIDKIAYCYERELLAKPGLAGTIQVQFLIAPNGSVQSAIGAGFDETVARCVAGVVKNISFPAPKTGGSVQVNYPFTFHAAGAGQ